MIRKQPAWNKQSLDHEERPDVGQLLERLKKWLRRDFGYNSSRYRLRLEVDAFAASIPTGAVVLDAGAGDQPYRICFQHTLYESADFEKVDKKDYPPSTHKCDLKHIPVENQRYDFVVFTQVMAHLSEPEAVLRELYRVLKPGGKLLYTGPFFFQENQQPYDFYRYTQFGVRFLSSQAGFNVERLDWLEGYFGTVAYQLHCMARFLPIRPADLGSGAGRYLLVPVLVPLRVFFGGLSLFFHLLETHFKVTRTGYPKNYLAILRKGP